MIHGSYLGRRRFEGTFTRNGLTMTFRGWAYALEEYARALERAGLLIEAAREPAPDAASTSKPARRARVPMFLWARALRPV
ncbi:MAG: hypothetical protein ACRDN9_08415 [Streptosporangiaceae bacterium]